MLRALTESKQNLKKFTDYDAFPGTTPAGIYIDDTTIRYFKTKTNFAVWVLYLCPPDNGLKNVF